jgi:hypothetical protein
MLSINFSFNLFVSKVSIYSKDYFAKTSDKFIAPPKEAISRSKHTDLLI